MLNKRVLRIYKSGGNKQLENGVTGTYQTRELHYKKMWAVVAQTYNSSTWEVEAGKPGVQGHPLIQSEVEAIFLEMNTGKKDLVEHALDLNTCFHTFAKSKYHTEVCQRAEQEAASSVLNTAVPFAKFTSQLFTS